MGRGKDKGRMTKEQMRRFLPEGTGKEQAALMEAVRAEVKQYKEAAEAAQKELARKDGLLRAAEEKARAYDELKARYESEKAEAERREEEARFMAEIESALRERGVRSVKAAVALMDIEALRRSENRREEINRAVEALAAGEEGSFLFAKEKTGRKVNIGGGRFGAGTRMSENEAIRRAAGLK